MKIRWKMEIEGWLARSVPKRGAMPFCILLLLSAFCLQASGQTYSIDRDSIGGSGGTSSSGQYAVSDIIGQPTGGNALTGGNDSFDDGFLSLSFLAHSAPLAQPMTVYRTAGLTLKIALSDVATNWSDPGGYAVTLAGINLATTNGVNLFTNSSFIFYTNSPNVNDQIAYGIADTAGATNTGIINIVIVSSVSGQQTVQISTSGGNPTLSFAGIPNYTYSVQRSTNLTVGVGWVPIRTTNAPANGLFNFTDPNPPMPAAYYRLSWSP